MNGFELTSKKIFENGSIRRRERSASRDVEVDTIELDSRRNVVARDRHARARQFRLMSLRTGNE
jgi:hypothetical protein